MSNSRSNFFFLKLGKDVFKLLLMITNNSSKNSLEMFFFAFYGSRGSVVFPESMRCHVANRNNCRAESAGCTANPVRLIWPYDKSGSTILLIFFLPALGSQVSYQNIVLKSNTVYLPYIIYIYIY